MATFATNDDPVDAAQIEGAHMADQGFDTDEPHVGADSTKIVEPVL